MAEAHFAEDPCLQDKEHVRIWLRGLQTDDLERLERALAVETAWDALHYLEQSPQAATALSALSVRHGKRAAGTWASVTASFILKQRREKVKAEEAYAMDLQRRMHPNASPQAEQANGV